MSGETPGQLAYEAFRAARMEAAYNPEDFDRVHAGAWEAAAAAGAAPAHERTAELLAEVNELSSLLANAHSETRSFLARMDALARELEALSARHAPSVRSETEAAVAKRLRAITCTDPAIDPPREPAVAIPDEDC